MSTNDTIICRCEDITLGEIRAQIAQGKHTLEEIKRACRAGMGPCQGRTCSLIIANEIAKATGKSIADIPLSQVRPPTAPIKMASLLGGDKHD